MVGTHRVDVINNTRGYFTVGTAGMEFLRLKLVPDEWGRLKQDNRARGKKKGVFYVQSEKTKRDYIMMALRAQLIQHINTCRNIKQLQHLYATTKAWKAKAPQGANQQNKKDEPAGAGNITADNTQL